LNYSIGENAPHFGGTKRVTGCGGLIKGLALKERAFNAAECRLQTAYCILHPYLWPLWRGRGTLLTGS